MAEEHRRPTAQPVASLRGLVGQLVRLPCWNVGFSYGDELFLDLGGRRAYLSGPMKGKPYGEWQLFTRASPWQVEGKDGRAIVSSTDDRHRAEPLLADLIDSRVTGTTVSDGDLSLSLYFDTGARLVIPCSTAPISMEPNPDEEIACWELITPAASCAEAWPARRWRLLPDERT